MNSKERVRSALERKGTDRVPIFMWLHPDATRKLAARLEIPANRVSEALGDDIRQAWVNNNYAMEGIVHERDGESHVDFWGVKWVKEGPFNQIAGFPLAGASREETLRYEYPYSHLEELMDPMKPVAAVADRYFIGCDVSPCVFEMHWRLRGLETTLEELAADRALTQEMFRRSADFAIRLSEIACERFPLDWLWTGDDVASQQSLLMSPRSWRALVKPELARVFAVAQSRGMTVAYHCCGALREIIPDLIEIGLDVLNPVQSNCPGMNPADLKREYGKDLAFMGGVDTQDLLPNGSANEVRDETARLIEAMTRDGGGYILAASHAIPPETPFENIFAMYAAAGLTEETIRERAALIRAEIEGNGSS